MTDASLEQLVESLLWEGYALYPYTPGATKNATPTPFGIVYPPVYAAECDGAFDHARLECLARGGTGVRATIRYLESTGERHQAVERRLELGPLPLGERTTTELPGARFTLRSSADGVVRCCVHNTTVVEPGLDRAGALARSLISVHVIVTLDGGRFVSPLEAGCESVNTFPVLATAQDDTILGATIALPDHPRIAPESLGSLFDSTEIEEALLLHVQALSDGERAEIERADPAVREMIERAVTTTPEQILALHGRVTLRDPREGEQRTTVGDVTFRRGCKLRLSPSPDADLHARMHAGRVATLERILIDYDGRVHLGVTVDDQPGQELLRETGRFIYFFAEEVEVIEP